MQHNEYSQVAWFEARQILQLAIEQQRSPQQIRQQVQRTSIHRSANILRGQRLAIFPQLVWSRTIADIRLENDLDYCADVYAWAKSILADSAIAIQNS